MLGHLGEDGRIYNEKERDDASVPQKGDNNDGIENRVLSEGEKGRKSAYPAVSSEGRLRKEFCVIIDKTRWETEPSHGCFIESLGNPRGEVRGLLSLNGGAAILPEKKRALPYVEVFFAEVEYIDGDLNASVELREFFEELDLIEGQMPRRWNTVFGKVRGLFQISNFES